MPYSPTAPFTLTTYSADPSTAGALAYKTAIDDNMAVFQRFGTNFAVSELTTSTRGMQARINAGFILYGTALTEVATQFTTAIAPPSAAPRIDRVVIDAITGAASVVTGTEAASPSAPAVPSGKIPVAQLALEPGVTAVGNSMLTDERAVWGAYDVPLPADYQEFTSTGVSTWNMPNGCSTKSFTMFLLWGAGSGGSGTTAAGGGGGGGGACLPGCIPTMSLSTAVSVTIGASAAETDGENSLFGSFIAYGGISLRPLSLAYGGGGGGVLGKGASTLNNGGPPRDGDNVIGYNFGGGNGGISGWQNATPSAYGGGGGGGGSGTASVRLGAASVFGGGGGAGDGGASGGLSVFGGNGGGPGVAGAAPGGGGGGSTVAGSNKAGGRGELRVWTWR